MKVRSWNGINIVFVVMAKMEGDSWVCQDLSKYL